MNKNTITNFIIAAALSFGVLFSVGCSDGKPKRIPVRGTITFKGMEMPQSGTIYFAPQKENSGIKRPAMASFSKNGTFAVSSFGRDKQDGLLPGIYKVYVEAFETMPTLENPTPKTYVSAQYSDPEKTPLSLEVKSGSGKIVYDLVIESN